MSVLSRFRIFARFAIKVASAVRMKLVHYDWALVNVMVERIEQVMTLLSVQSDLLSLTKIDRTYYLFIKLPLVAKICPLATHAGNQVFPEIAHVFFNPILPTDAASRPALQSGARALQSCGIGQTQCRQGSVAPCRPVRPACAPAPRPRPVLRNGK